MGLRNRWWLLSASCPSSSRRSIVAPKYGSPYCLLDTQRLRRTVSSHFRCASSLDTKLCGVGYALATDSDGSDWCNACGSLRGTTSWRGDAWWRYARKRARTWLWYRRGFSECSISRKLRLQAFPQFWWIWSRLDTVG